MGHIEKHGADSLYFLRHNFRELPPEKISSNKEIDIKRTPNNYHIIRRGKTAEEANKYRLNLEKEIFHYNRKDLVHTAEIIITKPTDCAPEDEYRFFKESVDYISSTLPMGERAIISAVVHKDEGHILKDGHTVLEASPHLHVMFIPAVKDSKHPDFNFKICANDLLNRSYLNKFHPGLEKWLRERGIKASVRNGSTGGINIPVSQLKELTKETGLTLSQVKDLALNYNETITRLKNRENELARLYQEFNKTNTLNKEIETQNEELKNKLFEKTNEIEKTKLSAQHIIAEKEKQLIDISTNASALQKRINDLEATLAEMKHELELSKEKVQNLENYNVKEKDVPISQEWSKGSSWGAIKNDWGVKDHDLERTW